MSEQCKNCGGAKLYGAFAYAGKVCTCNVQVSINTVTDNSAVIATMQAEITALKASNKELVEALELAKVTFIANNMDVRNVMEVINEALAKAKELG